jgi:hypothetical protein
MSKQMNSEILNALLKAANAAEQAGDFRLADSADELAQRVAQLSTAVQFGKTVAKPALTYLGNDQVILPTVKGLTNATEGKALGEGVLESTPVNMLGIGGGDYFGSLTDPLNWGPDAVMALNKMRFMNMLRSQLISAGYTELANDNVWRVFKNIPGGQGGLEDLLREADPKAAAKFLGEQKATPRGLADFFTRFRERARANKGTHWARFKARYITSAGWGGSANLSAERAERVRNFINSKMTDADKALSTEELIKKYRRNVDDVEGFDRSKVKTKAPKTPKPNAIKGANSVISKASSAKDLVQKAGQYLKERPELIKQALSKAGKTEEGVQWLKFLKSNSKDATKVGKGMKALGRIAMVIAIADIISDVPGAVAGDAQAQLDIYINTLGLAFPPLAIATALTSLFGLDLSEMIIANVTHLGEVASGVDTAQTNEDLINAGMTYNPQTKEWENGGVERSYDTNTGKSFEAGMMNMVKSGMSINQAWLITLRKMKASGSTPEEILTARQKYNQAKTMIYNEGMIGSIKAPMWSESQIAEFEKSLNKHIVAKLNAGVAQAELLREIDSYMRKVPNLRMISAIRSRVVGNLNAAQKSIEKGEKPITPQGQQNTTTKEKVNNTLMSRAQRSRGPRVAIWQKFLAQNGFFPGYNQNTPAVFGPRTTRGTRAFQSRYNLRVDGAAGPETLAKARQLGGKL